MSFIHGRKSAASVNGTLLTAYSDTAAFNVDVDTADTSCFGNTWKTEVVGMAGAKFDLSGDYDPTATVGPQAVLQACIGIDPFACIYYPGGNTTGQVKHAFSAILTSYSESTSASDKVTWSASFILSGADVITAVP